MCTINDSSTTCGNVAYRKGSLDGSPVSSRVEVHCSSSTVGNQDGYSHQPVCRKGPHYHRYCTCIIMRTSASIGFINDVVYGVSGNLDKGNVRKLRLILDEAERWRKSHGAQFEVSKYVLVHFTRNNRLKTDASITVNRSKVTPSDEAKYLGVVFDRGLRFGSHLQLLVKRGTNAAMALASIAKSSWGAPYRYVWQLFLAVIAPSTDYGAIVWHRPKYDGSPATSAQIRRLTTIQRLAMKAILGC